MMMSFWRPVTNSSPWASGPMAIASPRARGVEFTSGLDVVFLLGAGGEHLSRGLGADGDRLADRADVRQHVRVREKHALRRPRAPGGVLDEGGILARLARRQDERPRPREP